MRLDEMSFRDLVDELPLLPFSKRLLLIAVLWLVFLVLGYVLFITDCP